MEKTIFEISNDVRKDYTSNELSDKIINNVDLLIKIYNILLIQLIENNALIDVIKLVNTDLNIIMQKIIKLSMENTDTKIKCILTFITYLKKDDILDYVDIFIKKLKKKGNINHTKLEQIILEDNFDEAITPIKYVNFLLNKL